MNFECWQRIACECGECNREGSKSTNSDEDEFKPTRLKNHIFELMSGAGKTRVCMLDLWLVVIEEYARLKLTGGSPSCTLRPS
jgi:hypothetical protein